MKLKAMKQLAVESFVESSILLLPDFAHASDANGPKRTSASHLRLVAMYFQLYEHVLKFTPLGLHAMVHGTPTDPQRHLLQGSEGFRPNKKIACSVVLIPSR